MISIFQELFVYPAMGAFFLLVIHAWKTRGRRFTLLYFLGGFAFGFIREFFYVHYKQNYDYSGLAIKIFDVPPVAVLGWIFTFYIGLCFGERLLGFTCQEILTELQSTNDEQIQIIWKGKILPLLISVAFFTGLVCFAIESCAINMDWWRFIGYSGEFVTNPVQYMWTQTGIIFTTIFFLVYFKEVRLRKNVLFLVAFTAKYIAEDFLYRYLDPVGIAIFWILVLVIPILFYEEFAIYYMIVLFGGRLLVNILLIETPWDMLILKIVFFVPQMIYFFARLIPYFGIKKK